jgi:glycerol-1-phosphate dehydrogenase [NAD(P)+]
LKKIIKDNAIVLLPVILKDISSGGDILLIADNRTYEAAGEGVDKVLVSNGFRVKTCLLQRKESLIPDEQALGEILVAMEPGIEVLFAVGSGSITDLTRYVSSKLNKQFIAVPTAPSMDGYASSVAPLTIHGFKQTLPAVSPVAIVADIGVLAGAPREMILAGIGDLLGKYTSLADWKLGSIINGESYSQEIATEVRSTLDQMIAGLSSGISDPVLIHNLMEALLVSGAAMQQWGNSRPASGSEHHLAHFWEMQAALAGKKSHLHGTKVGVAVILIAGIYHRLFDLDIEQVKELIKRSTAEKEEGFTARVKKVYGPLASDVFVDLKGLYLDQEKRTARQLRIVENWELMKSWVKANLPTAGQIKNLMLRIGAPVEPGEIGVDEAMVRLAFQNAKEVRPRYTILRLAEDIGWEF